MLSKYSNRSFFMVTVVVISAFKQGCQTNTPKPVVKSSTENLINKPIKKPITRAQPQYLTTRGNLRSKADLVREGMTKDSIRKLIGAPDQIENIWTGHSTWHFNAAKCLVSWGATGFTYQTTHTGRCSVQFSKPAELVNAWDFNRVSAYSTGTYCVANCPAGVRKIVLPIRSNNGYTFN